MKFQRKIVVLLCCLIFMGTLSFDALSAQAALCKEHIFLVEYRENLYYEEDGHYKESGLMCQCVNCGYEYWKEGTYKYDKIGDHEFKTYTFTELKNGWGLYESMCETPGCYRYDFKFF